MIYLRDIKGLGWLKGVSIDIPLIHPGNDVTWQGIFLRSINISSVFHGSKIIMFVARR
jgi:hypothetical protein